MITLDVERGRAVARLLYDAFLTTGIHGHKVMPEDPMPIGVSRGSLEHLLFLTLTVAIDYQRDADSLWESARLTFDDPETRYVFSPCSLHETPWQKVRNDLRKHRLSQKPTKDSGIWRTVGITFHKQWNGDPRELLARCNYDATAILEWFRTHKHENHGHSVHDFPYLRGPKIGPLWLRLLRDNAGIKIENLCAVDIPVDVHVARSTIATGVLKGNYAGSREDLYARIRDVWKQSVQGLRVGDRDMIALDLDEALWHLSKDGCTNRDPASGQCPLFAQCEAKAFCVRGTVALTGKTVDVAT